MMKCTKLNNFLMFLGFFFSSLLLQQNALASCYSIENNSCWHVKNLGSQHADITCGMVGLGEDFYRELEPDQLESYQYPAWYNDGMGYPGTPNDGARCVGRRWTANSLYKFPSVSRL